ncbi:MAG: hypothetical protein ACE5GO_04690, partial [Anaerolineales bacterium]
VGLGDGGEHEELETQLCVLDDKPLVVHDRDEKIFSGETITDGQETRLKIRDIRVIIVSEAGIFKKNCSGQDDVEHRGNPNGKFLCHRVFTALVILHPYLV